MIKIAYITNEQYTEYHGKMYSDIGLFSPIQDDLSGQYYTTSYEIENVNQGEFLWLIDLEQVDLPEHEKYKFKLSTEEG
jgi:hypothetical protein